MPGQRTGGSHDYLQGHACIAWNAEPIERNDIVDSAFFQTILENAARGERLVLQRPFELATSASDEDGVENALGSPELSARYR